MSLTIKPCFEELFATKLEESHPLPRSPLRSWCLKSLFFTIFSIQPRNLCYLWHPPVFLNYSVKLKQVSDLLKLSCSSLLTNISKYLWCQNPEKSWAVFTILLKKRNHFTTTSNMLFSGWIKTPSFTQFSGEEPKANYLFLPTLQLLQNSSNFKKKSLEHFISFTRRVLPRLQPGRVPPNLSPFHGILPPLSSSNLTAGLTLTIARWNRFIHRDIFLRSQSLWSNREPSLWK